MSEGTQRRLAAIVSADVVGYSRLIGVDEAGTLAALRNHRAELIDGKIAEHGGRIVKTMGDGLLLEFPSVVDATQCVIDVQQAMARRNEPLDEEKRIIFRIGVHLGDLVVEGDDIFGDGINIAARLEAFCEAGGVAISGTAHENIAGRVEVGFIDAGDQQLKNISRPVRVWQWTPAASIMPRTGKVLALPDKPSIAVLPFDNMSGDPEQEYFSDGITEDIITALSRFHWFFVTARNSSFTYKGQAVDVTQVGRELGVRYVLEGSVRKGGSRVRITAQLIEAATGNHIWAERYDRELDNIFELQDEITVKIAAAVEPELASSEQKRSIRKPTSDLQAWDLFQRGVAKLYQNNRESLLEGVELLKQAISLDPNFGQAYAYLALATGNRLLFGWVTDREVAMQKGIADAKKAISIDHRDSLAHYILGRLLLLKGDRAGALQEMELSVAINPSNSRGYYGLAAAMNVADEFEKSIEYIDHAILLSPNDPFLWAYLSTKASAYRGMEQYEKAIELYEAASRSPAAGRWILLGLAVAYVNAGRHDEAAAPLAQALDLEPGLSVANLKTLIHDINSASPTRQVQFIDSLRKAGLPEE